MSKAKKIVVFSVLSVLVLIAALMLSLGHIIKAGVNTVGPKLAGVPVRLDRVVVNPLSGMVRIKGLLIGNPEGFNTPSAMELNDFKLKIDMASLLTDVVVIEEILISGPQITYERGLRDSNLSRLQKNLTPPPGTPAPDTSAEKPAKPAGEPKKVVIEDFQLNDAKVNVTVTALGGRTMVVPLPALRLQNIGKKSNGATVSETVSEIFKSITGAVVEAAASVGGMAGDTLKDAGGTAAEAAKGATDAAKDAAGSLIKGVGGLLGK